MKYNSIRVNLWYFGNRKCGGDTDKSAPTDNVVRLSTTMTTTLLSPRNHDIIIVIKRIRSIILPGHPIMRCALVIYGVRSFIVRALAGDHCAVMRRRCSMSSRRRRVQTQRPCAPSCLVTPYYFSSAFVHFFHGKQAATSIDTR